MMTSCCRSDLKYPASPQGRELVETLSSVPRKIPPYIREELATFLVMELIDRKNLQIRDSKRFIERYGIFYPLLIHLHHTELWEAIKELAEDSPETAVPIASLFISRVFFLIDQIQSAGGDQWTYLDEIMSTLIKLCDGTDSNKSEAASPGLMLHETILKFISKFKDLLALLPSEQVDNSISLNKFRELFMKLLKKLDANLSDNYENRPFEYSEEISELVDRLVEAINRFNEEVLESTKDLSDSLLPGSDIQSDTPEPNVGEEKPGNPRSGGLDDNGGSDP